MFANDYWEEIAQYALRVNMPAEVFLRSIVIAEKLQGDQGMGVARIFSGGEHFFKKFSKKVSKNFQKIFKKYSKNIQKNFQKVSKNFKIF